MNIPYYTSTLGLERYPESDRFAVYRAAHKRLMHEDAEYRRRCVSYYVAVGCLALIPIVGWAVVVLLAFRQQAFQNQRIGTVLEAAA